MVKRLEYSEDALMNRMLFLSNANDINIVVEDTNHEYVYENIFERMLGDEIKIESIFPMNGKSGVEKAYKKNGKYYKGKPTFYIVDGDFDILLEKNKIVDDNYFYLERYNIESYYIEKQSVEKFMSWKMKKRKVEVSSIIKFDHWRLETLKKSTELFLNFVISKKEIPQDKTIGTYNKFVMQDGKINCDEIDSFISDLEYKIENYDIKKKAIVERFYCELNGDPVRLICGKYLINCLQRYLIAITGVNFKKDDFIYSLCNDFDIKELDYIKNGINAALKKQE